MKNKNLFKLIPAKILLFYSSTIFSILLYFKVIEKRGIDVKLILLISFLWIICVFLFYLLNFLYQKTIKRWVKESKNEDYCFVNQEKKTSDALRTLIHDIKNPLTVISGYASTILQYHNDFDDEKKKDFLKRIESESDKLSRQVKDYLNVLSHYEDIDDFKLSNIEIVESVKLCYSYFEDNARERNVKYKINILDNVLHINGNKAKLEFVISNIIINAFSNVKKDGLITLEVKREKKYFYFSVMYTYDKASEAEGNVIFNKNNNINDKKYNTDYYRLIIYISKKIIERHGGKLDCIENEKNMIKTIYFNIPLRKK